MLKKTIKHNDLDGNPTETDAYFNLTKAEAVELNIRNDLEVIGRSRNNNEIMDTFTRILQMSYGKRTGAGDFIKEGFPAFKASEAYSELFMEIWTNPEYAHAFIESILPADLVRKSGEQGSQADIPASMANHPSMQGYQDKRERTLDNFDQTPAVQPPAMERTSAQTLADQNDYKEFLAFKAAQSAKVEESTAPREDLI